MAVGSRDGPGAALTPSSSFGSVPAPETLGQELGCLVRLAGPLTLSYVIEFGLPIVTYMAVGRLGVEELDGLSLGIMTGNITGIALVAGLMTAMDTLASQAYGARNFKRVGLLAQRAAVICLTLSVPVVLLWWNIGAVLRRLGQDPAVCAHAARFLRVYSLFLYPFIAFEVAKKYITAQGIVTPIPIIMVACCAFHVGVTYALIWPLGLGFIGSPIALIVTYVVMASTTLACAAGWLPLTGSRDPSRCWGGWSWEAFREWGPFLRHGVAGVAQLCLEWWAFESLTLASGILGMSSLAATTIVLQLCTVLYNIPFGISVATSVRVGNQLGANNPCGAKRSCHAAVGLAFVVSSGIAAANFLLRDFWAALFTQSTEVKALVHRVMLVVAFMALFDGVQASSAGVLRGAGLQSYGAAINFAGLWAVGLPVGAYLGFARGWGVIGLWMGFLLGAGVLAVSQMTVLACIDWDRQAQRARQRAHSVPTETTPLLLPGFSPPPHPAAP